MHSSYALDASDFAVERDGKQQPLSELWPGGYQPGDRLGVVLAQPMDAVGCSNLICATITLFYDYLRATLGTGNFFRYCRHLPVRGRLRGRRLQPARRLAAAQVRDDPATRPPRRCWRRSTTARSRCWRSPRRARAAAARSCSRPGTPICRTCVASSPTRRAPAVARDADVHAGRKPRGRELRRAGDLLDAGLGRRRSRPSCGGCGETSTGRRSSRSRSYRTLAERRRRRGRCWA